ncbi:MAG TPA: PorP/SprF family type IX secretion system membrane protein [Chitinophagaceae bacterium]
MKGVFKVSLLVLLLVMGKNSIAQVDPHFSQYYVYPSWMNPAMTGVFDGTYRVSAIYRSQWSGIAGFNTPGVSFDMNTDKNISFGASIMNLKAGNAGYNYLTAYGSASYSGIRFGTNGSQRVVFGMQAGIMNRRFDPNKFTVGENWNPSGPNPNPTTETFTRTSATMFDMGAGALYIDGKPGKKANFYGGLAVSHLTQPEDDFIKDSDAKVPMRLTLHGGLRINVNENWSITPNFLFLSQAQSRETMLGAYAQVRATPTSDFLFGANYRFKDAFAPYVGFYHKNFVLGASYDFNTSDLGRSSTGANSFELSLTWLGRKAFKAEEEQFVCPRL